VVARLIDEVQGLNQDFMAQHIRDAAYRFYRSKCEEASKTKRGLLTATQKVKRRHERIARVRKICDCCNIINLIYM